MEIEKKNLMANKASRLGPYSNKRLERTKGLFHILLMPHFLGFTKCKNFSFLFLEILQVLECPFPCEDNLKLNSQNKEPKVHR
jgi:hypothetical protein